MSVTGEADGPPLKVGAAVVDLVCGLLAVAGIEAALVERERTGRRAPRRDLAAGLGADLAAQPGLGLGVGGRRARRAAATATRASRRTRPTRRPTARSRVAVGNDRLFARLCEAVGLPELASDERFATNTARVANLDALGEALEAVFAHAAGRPLGRGPARGQRPRRPDQQRLRGLRARRVARARADPRGRRRPARSPARRFAAAPAAGAGRARRRDPGLAPRAAAVARANVNGGWVGGRGVPRSPRGRLDRVYRG